MIIYEAYVPAHTKYIEGFPTERNVGGMFTDRWITYNPVHEAHVAEQIMKRFLDETECLKYCVKHGCQYREIEVE